MRKLKLSSTLNLHSHPKDGITEYIGCGLALMKDAGFDAADFPMGIISDHLGAPEPLVESILSLSQSIGIGFEVCHLPFSTKISTNPELLPAFNALMYRSIDVAALLGVKYAVLHPNAVTEPLSEFNRTKKYDEVMAHLAPFNEYAIKKGVNLAVENMRVVHEKYPTHRYCGDPDELCDIADALGIGVCWDFGHANICGHRQSEALRYVGKRLKTVHVNDNTAYDDDHIPPFSGSIDWKDAMEGLSEIGYNGLFNYEIATARIPADARRAFAQYLVSAADCMMNYL